MRAILYRYSEIFRAEKLNMANVALAQRTLTILQPFYSQKAVMILVLHLLDAL